MCTIDDIYAGKPDAKDEVVYKGLDEFIKTLIVPSSLKIDELLSKDKCFITGLKGTGKTSILFNLDARLKSIDASTCTSIVFFNEGYSDIKRKQLHKMSKLLTSSINLGNDVLLGGDNYEYIWKWLLYYRICMDNEENSNNLFVQDEYWETFSKLITSISPSLSKKSIRFPAKVTLGAELKHGNSSVKPALEIDLTNLSKSENLDDFINRIDSADKAFANVTRTDIPYYIFIDELEAYYGDRDVFIRDLSMIRDLVFTVKYLNTEFVFNEMKHTKIICSVRTEVLNAISRFVVTKELNKTTDGFKVPIQWNYTNTNTSRHPIIQILLKRIMIGENKIDQDPEEVYKRWFPDKIFGTEPANYILNNGWNKPRDIVRFIICCQSSLYNTNTVFSQAVFDSIRKSYSQSSLEEIKEELRALYKPDELNLILNCFNGYKAIFSLTELEARVKKYYENTILDKNFQQIIQDLYRVGFLGNQADKRYRWNHKGDDDVILSEEWNLMIHKALQPALSLTYTPPAAKKEKHRKPNTNWPQNNEILKAKVAKELNGVILINIIKEKYSFRGNVKIKADMYLDDNKKMLKYQPGETVTVKIIGYDKKHKSYNAVFI